MTTLKRSTSIGTGSQSKSATTTVALGLDLSLTGPGIIVARVAPTTFAEVLEVLYPRTKPLDKTHSETGVRGKFFYGIDEERIDFILRAVRTCRKKYKVNVAGIEQYAFSRHSRSMTGLHELGGVVKRYLWLHGIYFEQPEPTSLKKFATGNGRASKQDMIEAAWGFGYPEAQSDDLADAFHCARFAAYRQSGAINQ